MSALLNRVQQNNGNSCGGSYDEHNNNNNVSGRSVNSKSNNSHNSHYSDDHRSAGDADDASATIGSTGGGQTASESAEVQKLIAQKETKAMRAWRLVVIVTFLVVGAIVSGITYIFLSQQEDREFYASYVTSVDTAREASVGHIRNIHMAFQDLASLYTQTAIKYNMTWPYVTLPTFEVQGQHAREQSDAEVFAFAPIVQQSQRDEWLNYSWNNQGWIEQSREVVVGLSSNNNNDHYEYTSTSYTNDTISTDLYRKDQISDPYGPHVPIWQFSPPPFNAQFVNWNLKDSPWMEQMLPALAVSKVGLFTNVYDLGIISGLAVSPEDHLAYHNEISVADDATAAYTYPHSIFLQPIYDTHQVQHIVGVFCAVVPWDAYLNNLIPDGRNGVVVVLTNNCGQTFTYELEGNTPIYIGEGDLHDPKYDYTKNVIPFVVENATSSDVAGHCEYSFVLYASQTFKDDSSTNTPVIFTVVVAVVFVVVVATFFMYDRFVQRRNSKVVDAATRSNAILSSLFPKNVRERLFEQEQQKAKMLKQGGAGANAMNVGGQKRLRSFLDDGSNVGGDSGLGDDEGFTGAPIADLFPDCTVLFADIAGFTAWSSVREPAQVFTLLETLYSAFDHIAKRRRVFKVETIGDCYVAVTGLPDPNKDHAISMARFARECTQKMRSLTNKLEMTLGPDTGDLSLRTGMHSGPVTAGVLRGERSRFQLFGDTMNTASRMESTGQRDKIQISQETADLLVTSGKSEWLRKREDKVVAKGKGEMQTYWLSIGGSGKTGSIASSGGDSADLNPNEEAAVDAEHAAMPAKSSKRAKPIIETLSAEKMERLIEWNVDVLHRLLKQIVARRRAEIGVTGFEPELVNNGLEHEACQSGTTIDEVAEIITLPTFSAKASLYKEDPASIVLPTAVFDQLYDYVFNIAAMYNENSFHNFEHASHVTMSVVKLLSRIVAPNDIELDENHANTGKSLHDHTYGITSDPLTQFACVISALIHDCDHSGVPNAQLIKEQTNIAEYYGGKSVAEQNSVDLAWQLLMDGTYTNLCRAIYASEDELKRFRQLVVNSVMATDIVDKELKTLRNARWSKAFSDSTDRFEESPRDTVNRKATIVIEHLIQASDVAHTMQHWHIYRKWNERFFIECYKAYVEGRAETNPADGWYKGEIGFYDFYIIPLARKLKDCGVFGVSSDEYLNYAIKNRKEWEDRGQELVDSMIEKVSKAKWANAKPDRAPNSL